MNLLLSAYLLVYPWLQDFSRIECWTNKYDKIYLKYANKYNLQGIGIDRFFLKAVAVVESCQKHYSKGGYGGHYWGLMQMSSELAKMFGRQKHKAMLDPDKNVKTFARWVSFFIKKYYLPYNKKRMAKGLPSLTKEDWLSLVYAGHNVGFNVVKWAFLHKDPYLYLVRKIAKKYDKRQGKYRVALFLLIPRLWYIARENTIIEKPKIVWWNRRDLYLMAKGCVGEKMTWKRRTECLEDYQTKNDLAVTGVWDTFTEKKIISLK